MKATKQSWSDMKQRCLNPRHKQYPNYGGRGITICSSWLESFDNFLADMGIKPDGLTLERIDNEEGYYPGNCRWATRLEQRHNQRTTHIIEHDGRRQPLRHWATEYGMSEMTLRRRIFEMHLSIQEALERPIRENSRAGGIASCLVRWGNRAAISAWEGKE